MTATLSSRPGTNCSANQRPPYSALRAANSCGTAAPSATDESSMPSEACSHTDLTIHGPAPAAAPKTAGVAMSAVASSALAASLSEVAASASEEQPVSRNASDSTNAG